MHEVELIKQHLSITAALERFTMADLSKLKGSKGHIPCPFHSDKHSSFYVDTIKDAWHCFGACATGGDVINLYARACGVGNREAIAQLCGLLGIEGDTPTREQREQLRREQEARELIGVGKQKKNNTISDLCAIYRAMNDILKKITGEQYAKVGEQIETAMNRIDDILTLLEDDKSPAIYSSYMNAKEEIEKWQILLK